MKQYDVIAIGELNVDLIVTGLDGTPRIGQETIADNYSLVLGSSTAICACGISNLGLKTGFVGKVGKDRFGEVVLEGLQKYGIDMNNIVADEEIKTGITISLSCKSDRALVTCLGSIDALRFEDIDVSLLKQTRHIHVGSYFLQSNLRSDIPRLFALAMENGASTSLDAGWDNSQVWDYGISEALKYTNIFFPNEVEALNITKADNVKSAASILSKKCETVVIKCGPRGAIAQTGSKQFFKDTYDLKPVDTTGAGDSFNAGYIYAYLRGFEVEKCLEYGNACGSISVTRIGGASSCASLDEVRALIDTGKTSLK